MRTPTPHSAIWAWWESAVAGEGPPVFEDCPQAGFYKLRRFRYGEWPRGPWVPARVWLAPGEIDPETGELLSDEMFRADIEGRAANPWRIWTWISRHPIPMEEWEWLTALSPLTAKKIPA